MNDKLRKADVFHEEKEAGRGIILKPVNLNLIMLKIYVRFRTEASEKGVQLSLTKEYDLYGMDILTDESQLTIAIELLVGHTLNLTSVGRVDFGYCVTGSGIEFFASGIQGTTPPGSSCLPRKCSSHSEIVCGDELTKSYPDLAALNEIAGRLGGSICLSYRKEMSGLSFSMPFEKTGHVERVVV